MSDSFVVGSWTPQAEEVTEAPKKVEGELVVGQDSSWGAGYGNSYKGAQITNNSKCWLPHHRSGDSAIRDSWSSLTSRVRDSIRNDPILLKARDQLVTLTIGPGLLSAADARVQDGSLITDFNDESDIWFERWCDDECDIAGEKTFDEMCALSFQETIEVGNCFWLEVFNPKNEICPLAYKLIEWEQVYKEFDRPGDENGVGRIENGIEYGRNGEKVALYVYSDHPYSDKQGNWRAVRLPWSRILHNYIPTRISSTSGISWFATMVLTARDIDWYLGNELTASAIGALLTLIVKRENPGQTSSVPGLDAAPAVNQAGCDSVVQLGQAITAEIGINEDVQIAESKRPSRNAADFINFLMVLQAMGSRLSTFRLKGDPAGATLSAIKAAAADDNTMIRPLQRHQEKRIVKPVRNRWTELAVANGVLPVSSQQYRRQRYRFNRLEIVPPAIASIDDVKEVDAAIARLRACLTNPQYESGRFGFHWRKNIQKMAEWAQECEEKGIISDWTMGQGTALTRPSVKEPDEDEMNAENGNANQTSDS